MALTSPDSRLKVSDPAKHAFRLPIDDFDDDDDDVGVYAEEPYTTLELLAVKGMQGPIARVLIVEVPEQPEVVYLLNVNLSPTSIITCKLRWLETSLWNTCRFLSVTVDSQVSCIR